jgi:hypothetical protein
MTELLKNIERSMYTFNFNNIVEICFDKVIKFNNSNNGDENKLISVLSKDNLTKLTEREKILLDNCIDKYMLSFNVVKESTISHLDKMFNNKV